MRTVVGVFEERRRARRTIDDLERIGPGESVVEVDEGVRSENIDVELHTVEPPVEVVVEDIPKERSVTRGNA